MKFLPYPNKRFTLFKYLLANMALSFLIILLMMRGAFHNWKTFEISFLWAFSICITQWTGLGFIYSVIDKRLSWIEKPVLKTFVHITTLLAYSTFAFIVVQAVNYYIWLDVPPVTSWGKTVNAIPYTILISSVISLAFTAIGFFNAWKQSFLQAQKLKAEMLAYKYESLRNQINPHFLFNSLNVLSELVYDDQALAVKFIRQLSDLFRYVLDSRDKELVRLGDELDFIRSFIFLLKTRFEEKLQIEIDVQARTDEYLVPMTLQLLIENAVKHNEVSDAFPLQIKIRKSGDYLEIENTLQPKNAGDDSKKTGLKNISQQFAFFSDKPIEIIPLEEKFLVRVPILKSVEK